jgi:hypothetical protein
MKKILDIHESFQSERGKRGTNSGSTSSGNVTTKLTHVNEINAYRTSSSNNTITLDSNTQVQDIDIQGEIILAPPQSNLDGKTRGNDDGSRFVTTNENHNIEIGNEDTHIRFPREKKVRFWDEVEIGPKVFLEGQTYLTNNVQIDSELSIKDPKNVICFDNKDQRNCLTMKDINQGMREMDKSTIDSLYFQSKGACLPSASLIQRNFNENDTINFTMLQDDMKCMYPSSGKQKLQQWYRNTLS